MKRAEYEFAGDENRAFERLARNLARVGWAGVSASTVLLAYHVVSYFGISLGKNGPSLIRDVDYALWGIISLIGVAIGARLMNAAIAFRTLTRTEGSDITHLIQGVSRMATILGVVFWAAATVSALVATSFVLLLTFS